MMTATNRMGRFYTETRAATELRRYRNKGPIPSTQTLIDAIKAQDVRGATLLDIGGGIGAIQHGLLDAGVLSVTSVDASAAYIAAAREESVRRGYSGRVTYRHGDFVELSESIPVADIVTLDRVINVCPDWERVVALSAPRARRIYGLVHPQDTPFVRLAIAAINVRLRLQQQAVRASVIPQDALDRILDANGFALHFSKGVGRVWQVAVYRRKPGA